MHYKKIMDFIGTLNEEERLVRLLKIVKKRREDLIKQDLNDGNRNDLLDMWKRSM